MSCMKDLFTEYQELMVNRYVLEIANISISLVDDEEAQSNLADILYDEDNGILLALEQTKYLGYCLGTQKLYYERIERVASLYEDGEDLQAYSWSFPSITVDKFDLPKSVGECIDRQLKDIFAGL